MATIAEAAAHIDLGERRFYELLEGDVIERCQPGEYNLDHVRVTYIRHIRKIGAGRGAEKGIDQRANAPGLHVSKQKRPPSRTPSRAASMLRSRKPVAKWKPTTAWCVSASLPCPASSLMLSRA